jgi:hypothetical protein
VGIYGADIDGSKVVWARDMGAEKNQNLIEYFSDRQVWLVKPDEVDEGGGVSVRPGLAAL